MNSEAENNQNQNTNNENTNRLTIDSLPEDVKQALPEEAQHMYIAAYNSIIRDGNEEAAQRVAWQTIERNESYAKDDQGKWYRLPEKDGKRSARINVTAS